MLPNKKFHTINCFLHQLIGKLIVYSLRPDSWLILKNVTILLYYSLLSNIKNKTKICLSLLLVSKQICNWRKFNRWGSVTISKISLFLFITQTPHNYIVTPYEQMATDSSGMPLGGFIVGKILIVWSSIVIFKSNCHSRHLRHKTLHLCNTKWSGKSLTLRSDSSAKQLRWQCRP